MGFDPVRQQELVSGRPWGQNAAVASQQPTIREFVEKNTHCGELCRCKAAKGNGCKLDYEQPPAIARYSVRFGDIVLRHNMTSVDVLDCLKQWW